MSNIITDRSSLPRRRSQFYSRQAVGARQWITGGVSDESRGNIRMCGWLARKCRSKLWPTGVDRVVARRRLPDLRVLAALAEEPQDPRILDCRHGRFPPAHRPFENASRFEKPIGAEPGVGTVKGATTCARNAPTVRIVAECPRIRAAAREYRGVCEDSTKVGNRTFIG